MSLDEAIYRSEDYYARPKESFRFLGERLAALPGDSLLDLGCARGEFIHYLQAQMPQRWTRLVGADLSPALIADARERLPQPPFAFHVGAIEALRLDEKFDLVSAAGVMGYLDDPGVLAATAAAHAAPAAHLIVFGFLNMADADVLSEFRYRGQREKANLHAHASLCAACAAHGFSHLGTEEFVLPFRLEPNPDNIRRAWTLDSEHGRWFANGLGQIFRLYAATFRRQP